jgi:hypothetical protein
MRTHSHRETQVKIINTSSHYSFREPAQVLVVGSLANMQTDSKYRGQSCHEMYQKSVDIASSLKSRTCKVLLSIFDEEAIRSQSQSVRLDTSTVKAGTYLYHHIVGPTVPRCHKLCASIMPPHGGKSNSSKLMTVIIQATIKPGHTAHKRPTFLYCT